MKQLIWLVLPLVIACGKEGPGSPSPVAEDVAGPEGDVPASGREAELALTAAKAKAFIAYRRDYNALIKEDGNVFAKMGKEADEGVYEGIQGHLKARSTLIHASKEFAEKHRALLEKHGLNEEEVEALSKLASAVLKSEMPMVKKLYAQIPQMEATLAKLPPEARAGYENKIEELKQKKAEAEAMHAERAAYGDAVVDAMLADKDQVVSVMMMGSAVAQ